MLNGSFRKRARSVPRKPTGVRSLSSRSAGAVALREVRKLKRSAELKYWYNNLTGDAFSWALNGYLAPIGLVPAGALVANRIGQKTHLKDIQFRMKLISNIPSNVSWRVLLVQDTQQVGDTYPAVGDVLQNGRTNSMYQDVLNQQRRFRILHDWTTVQNANFVNQDMSANHNFFKRLDFDQFYNGPLSTDIQKNGLYLIILADTSSGTGIYTPFAAGDVLFDLQYVVRYTDM